VGQTPLPSAGRLALSSILPLNPSTHAVSQHLSRRCSCFHSRQLLLGALFSRGWPTQALSCKTPRGLGKKACPIHLAGI
jgi:hypothetical protein